MFYYTLKKNDVEKPGKLNCPGIVLLWRQTGLRYGRLRSKLKHNSPAGKWKSVLYTLQNWTEKETAQCDSKVFQLNLTVCSLTSVNPRRPFTTPYWPWKMRGPLRRSWPTPPPASTSGTGPSPAWGWLRPCSSRPPSPPLTQRSSRLTRLTLITITIKRFSSCRQIICQILTTTECLTMATMSTISMFRYGLIKYFFTI